MTKWWQLGWKTWAVLCFEWAVVAVGAYLILTAAGCDLATDPPPCWKAYTDQCGAAHLVAVSGGKDQSDLKVGYSPEDITRFSKENDLRMCGTNSPQVSPVDGGRVDAGVDAGIDAGIDSGAAPAPEYQTVVSAPVTGRDVMITTVRLCTPRQERFECRVHDGGVICRCR